MLIKKVSNLLKEAVRALSDAVKGNDTKELLTIFGPAGKELISSGDKVADETGRERFIKAYEEMNKLVSENDHESHPPCRKRRLAFPDSCR